MSDKHFSYEPISKENTWEKLDYEFIRALRSYSAKNPNTANTYRYAINEYISYCAIRNLSPAEAETLKTFMDFLTASGRSSRSVNIKLCGIKNAILFAAVIVRYSLQDYAVLKISLDEIKGIKADMPKKPPHIISRQEKDIILKSCSPKTALMIEFLFTTGCRISEMTSIRLNRVHIRGKIAEITIMGISGKERYVIIPVSLFLVIQTSFKGKVFLFETRNHKMIYRQYITTEIRKKINKTLNRSGSAKDLRLSFAEILTKKTGKFKAVSYYIGNSEDPAFDEPLSDNDLLEIS